MCGFAEPAALFWTRDVSARGPSPRSQAQTSRQKNQDDTDAPRRLDDLRRSDRTARALVACPECDRLGRYSVRRLALQYGREGKLTDWINLMTKECPRRQSSGLADACGAQCPEPLKLARRPGGGSDKADDSRGSAMS
jgi:hypothetical protein